MNRQRAWLWLFSATLAVFFFLLPVRVWADDDDYNNYSDPPSRAATINYMRGSVSFQPGGEGDWVDAVPNRPLIAGDNIWTDRGSRAEMHVGSTAVRLGSETSMTLLDLDDNTLQLRVAEGTVMIRMLHMDQDDLVEIDTPNLAFRVTRAGEFRVDVRPDGHTTIIEDVHGRGEVVGGGSRYTLVAGQSASFTGDDYLTYDIDSLPDPDEFDRWAFERDRREDQCRSANYVSREMTGYEDLDDYGSWSYAGSYGPVWYPSSVAYDWAPYRYGHWVWIAPWGWTWVDDEPWGFAPFHYGRWIVIGSRWAWVPGPVVARPVYAPALVVFVGGPSVAWFPLGPGEVFIPSYHVSRTYVNQVNITNTVVNVTNVTNVYNYYKTNNTAGIAHVNYVNRTGFRGVTAVSRETFVNARPVAKNTVAVQRQEIERAPVGQLPAVEPVRTSVVGIGRPTRVMPPAAVMNRRVVADRVPSPPPTPFSQRQDKLIVRPVTPPTQQVRPMPPVNRGDSRDMEDRRENRRDERTNDRTNDRTNRPEPPVLRQEPPVTRTEPVQNQPAQNPPAQRPEWQRPAPGAPAVMTQPAPVQRPETSSPPAQPERTTEPPRPDKGRRPVRDEQENQAQPPQGWSHPLARPAPPVQPKSEQQVQDEEKKFHKWEQRQQPAPQTPPQRPDNKKDDKKDDKKH